MKNPDNMKCVLKETDVGTAPNPVSAELTSVINYSALQEHIYSYSSKG